MRKLLMTKFASGFALMMILSAALPFVAAASIYFSTDESDFSYQDGTVTAAVYVDLSVTADVYAGPTLYVDRNGTVTSVTYDTYEDIGDYRYFYFTSHVGSADSVKLTADYGHITNGTVTTDTYKALSHTVSDPGDPGDPGNGGGGGTIVIPGDPSGDIVENGTITAASLEVSAQALEQAFASHDHVTIIVDGDHAILPAGALQQAGLQGDTKITLVTDHGTYTLPLLVFHFDELANELDIPVADMTIRITVEAASSLIKDEIAEQAESIGATVQAEAVNFEVAAEAPNGDQLAIESFGDTYVERTIALSNDVDESRSTGVVFNPTTGEFSFVPSVFSEVDNPSMVTLKRNSNSVYTVLSLNKFFVDVPVSHWGRQDVDILTNKLIVFGMDENTFAPNQNVTRAEFAGLLVKSLGLSQSQPTNPIEFSDVPEHAWYAKEVAIAADAGLVYGYEDDTFRPNRMITREELAAMVVRAVNYAGVQLEVSLSEQNNILAPYTDSDHLSWGQNEFAAAVKANIVYGMGNDILAPSEYATRIQATAMLKRYLDYVGFIN